MLKLMIQIVSTILISFQAVATCTQYSDIQVQGKESTYLFEYEKMYFDKKDKYLIAYSLSKDSFDGEFNILPTMIGKVSITSKDKIIIDGKVESSKAIIITSENLNERAVNLRGKDSSLPGDISIMYPKGSSLKTLSTTCGCKSFFEISGCCSGSCSFQGRDCLPNKDSNGRDIPCERTSSCNRLTSCACRGHR